MPAFIPILQTLLKHAFWYCQQLLFRFFFYLLNCSWILSFYRYLLFWEEEKVSGGQFRWIRWLRHDYGFLFFLPKTHSHASILELVHYHGAKSMIVFSTILCFAPSAHNFKVVFLIDRTTLWQEFMMHPAIAIEDNSPQNLHIWPNLVCFFQS